MEQQPHNPDDRDIPEQEQLWPGEIDLTGVVEQDDALRDVIGDAIGEAEDSEGEVPEWGARTLARALANEYDHPPFSGALHHYAVTGRANREAIARELAELSQATDDDEIHEWIGWLRGYMTNLPDPTDAPAEVSRQPEEIPISGTPLEQVAAYLRIAFAKADDRGEAIDGEDAQAVATLLAALLEPDSEMARFAETGDANPVVLHEECRHLGGKPGRTPDVDVWLRRLEQHLASRTDLGRRDTSSPDQEPDDE